MQQPGFVLAVVMQKRPIDNRWQSDVWEPVAVLADTESGNKPEKIKIALDNKNSFFLPDCRYRLMQTIKYFTLLIDF